MSGNSIDKSDKSAIILKLYVTGQTLLSMRAIENIKKICERYIEGHYDLEIIDIYNRPSLARRQGVLATPMLVKQNPLPVVHFIGDMSKTEKILDGLAIIK
ncbi:MAG: circadian clock KaiB family protein [Candidatus Magnetominusculus sp. LBB02]|nr:circadian clock KaiB family protein [Candidatus Magnetominusculus sp. LBB02]